MYKIFPILFLPIFLIVGCKNSEKSTQSQSAYFAGEIYSVTSIQPKHDGVNVDSIKQTLIGSETRYFIQDSLYKSMHYFDGDLQYYYVYEPTTKRMYDFYTNRPYITYRDSRVNMSAYPDEQFDQFRDSVISYQGVEAFLVKVRLMGRDSDIYYSNDLAVNIEYFKDHAAGGWNETLTATGGALPVLSYRYRDSYTEIKEAKSITWGRKPLNFFTLPDSLEVYPSFSVLEEKPQLIEPTTRQIVCYRTKTSRIPDLVYGEETMEFFFRFIVTEEGDIKYPKAVSPEFEIVGEIGVEILEDCGLTFTPAKINNEVTAGEILFRLPFIL